MGYRRRLAVPGLWSRGDHAAVCNDDRLMTQAYAEGGDALTESLDEVHREARSLGSTGAGGDHQTVGRVFRKGFFGRKHVVADHHWIRPEFAQVLHEVERERVVVVEDQHLHPTAPPESSSVDPSQSQDTTRRATMGAPIKTMAIIQTAGPLGSA